MKIRITKISELKKVLTDMILTGRPVDDHPRIEHAPNIDKETIMSVVGNLVMYADNDSIEIGTRTSGGYTYAVNQLWFTVNNAPYAAVYSGGAMEIRSRSLSGSSIHKITKTATPTQIAAVFAAL